MSFTGSMTQNDPIDASKASGWTCQICSVEQPNEATYCQLCLYARPLSRRGVPQIFAGYAIHFNGIIPRTILHPSHSVEWRMAERHGAVGMIKFDPSTVNLLVYRPGYERSEKCRTCVEKYTRISAVPITWMLDSLLQSRQIHTSLYRLTFIPAVANATVRGTDLPHHQHPFYQINKDEYNIPTSFPSPRKNNKSNDRILKGFSGKGISLKDASMFVGTAGINLPPFYDVDPFQFTSVNVYDAALACIAGKNKEAADDENDEVEVRKQKASLDLILLQQSHNKVDKMLFSGMRVALSPTLQTQKNLIEVLKGSGATIVNWNANPEKALSTEVTHVVYAHQDKKNDILISAAHIRENELPGLQLAQSNWIEDCLILGELLPLHGMYVPSQKLMETLSKKYAKTHA